MSVAVKAVSLLGSKLVIVPKDAVMTRSEPSS